MDIETGREVLSSTIWVAGASLVHEGHPDRNEDSYIADVSLQLIGAFDGVGGHPGSEEASRTAAAVIHREVHQFPACSNAKEAESLLHQALTIAHSEVVERGHGQIGTTAAIAKVFYDEAGQAFVSVASVADSRIYLYRNGELSFLSYDSGREYTEASIRTINRQRNLAEVSQAVSVAALSVTSQVAYRHRNLINSMLGQADSQPIITTHSIQLEAGDIILTTTDGVHDNLTHKEIAHILATTSDSIDAAQVLTSAARERSRNRNHLRAKPDDMTAALLYYGVK